MREITFVRHAESVSNAGGITMDHVAIPLSELGHRQARRIALELPPAPSLVLVSPMVRTVQSAAPYCELHGLRAETCSALAEFSPICPTTVSGLTGEQRKPHVADYWANPDPNRRNGPGADTFTEFLGRVRAFESQLLHLPTGTVIFGHGIWFGLYLWRLLGFSTEDAESMTRFRRFQLGLPMPNCAVFKLHHDAVEWRVRADEATTRAAHSSYT